ncbi:MAG: hypothetical protein AB6733_05035 [Clostridiaceae bacterium]
MKSKGVINEILSQLIDGVTREELNKNYNPASVTKAYNKYLEKVDKQSADEETIEELFKKIFKIVDKEGEYEVTIKISTKEKKKPSFNRSPCEKEAILINPYDVFYKSGKDEFINELKSKDVEYLMIIAKRYFSDRSGKIYKEKNKEKIIDYIVSSMEKLLNIGKSFRKQENK